MSGFSDVYNADAPERNVAKFGYGRSSPEVVNDIKGRTTERSSNLQPIRSTSRALPVIRLLL